jgi:hypothetical protein
MFSFNALSLALQHFKKKKKKRLTASFTWKKFTGSVLHQHLTNGYHAPNRCDSKDQDSKDPCKKEVVGVIEKSWPQF